MQPAEIALIVIGIVAALFVLMLLLLSGGNTQRIGVAFRCFGRALSDPGFAEQAAKLLAPPEPKSTRPSGVRSPRLKGSSGRQRAFPSCGDDPEISHDGATQMPMHEEVG